MEFNEHQIQPKETENPEKNPEKKGRRVCAWCKKDLGEFDGKGTSHGICPECKKKMEQEHPEIFKKNH